MSSIIVSCITLVNACVLLSVEFGWKVGVGVTLLVHFHKAIERS